MKLILWTSILIVSGSLEEVLAELRFTPEEDLKQTTWNVQQNLLKDHFRHVFHTTKLDGIVGNLDASGTSEIASAELPGLYSFDTSAIASQFWARGVYTLSVWVCPQFELERCNTSDPNALAQVVRFTVCQEHSTIEEDNGPNSIWTARLEKCKCEPGFYGPDGGHPHLCAACESGRFSHDRGSQACEQCSAGSSCDCSSSSNIRNPASCTEVVALPACTACEACPQGQYQDKGAQIEISGASCSAISLSCCVWQRVKALVNRLLLGFAATFLA